VKQALKYANKQNNNKSCYNTINNVVGDEVKNICRCINDNHCPDIISINQNTPFNKLKNTKPQNNTSIKYPKVNCKISNPNILIFSN